MRHIIKCALYFRNVPQTTARSAAILFHGSYFPNLANTEHLLLSSQDAGFTHVWLPPPSQSVAPQGYLPGRLYDLNTPYGSKDELIDLLATLRKAGVKSMADIVSPCSSTPFCARTSTD